MFVLNRLNLIQQLLLFAVVLSTACGKGDRDTRPEKKSASPGRTDTSPAPDTSSGKNALKKTPAPPDPRHVLLQAEWEAYEDTVVTHDASVLEENERQMLTHLLAAAKVVEELYMLQRHPENLTWRDHLVANGADIEKKMFFRNQMPWCEDNPNLNCRAIADAPPKRIGLMHWPDGFAEKDIKSLSNEINGQELLSPFTIVRRNKAGGFLAVPYTRNALLGPKMKRLATLLRQAAEDAPDATLKTFLLSRADAFERSNAFPYDESDLDWIAIKGDWEVTVGPYEVYDNPFQTKALFEMFIGREEKVLSAELSKLKGRLQEMENTLAQLVGEAVYSPRQLEVEKIAIRAVDVWMASGDARNSRGATVAFHLPNRGEAVEKGLYKKVMLVNHSKAFESVAKARAELVLEPAQAAMVNFRDSITNVTFHELSHGFGAYHEMKIKDKEGRRTTVKEALRNYDSLMEELKADALGLMLSKYLYEKGELTEETLLKRYVCNLVHLLGLLQYPLDGTYPRMSAVQLGWFIDNKAVVWHEETKQLQLVTDKMSEAVESLTKLVSILQLTGDYKGTEKFYNKYIQKDESKIMLKGVLQQVREAVVEQFKKAGIKSPSLRYEVKGIQSN